MKILLTDGNQRCTLAVARDLAREGNTIIVGYTERASLAGSSKWVAERFVYPSPESQTDGFVDCVRGEAARCGAEVLLPMTDVTVSLVLQRRAEFGTEPAIPLPEKDVWDAAYDKLYVLSKAEEIGIQVPRTVVVPAEGEYPGLPSDLFPAVLRSRRSGFWLDGVWRKAGIRRVRSADEVRVAIADMDPRCGPFLLQEEVVGPGMGIFLLFSGGQVKAGFAHQRLREKPPAGGVSTYCTSVPLPNQLYEKTVALLRGFGWEGVAMVEFKQDHRDGTPKLMEINGRFWGSLQLAVACGVRFPSLLVRSLSDREFAPVVNYRRKTVQWILGDLDHVLAVVLRGRKPLAFQTLSRFRAMLGFLACLRPGVAHQVFSVSDPGPWVCELKQYFGYLVRKA